MAFGRSETKPPNIPDIIPRGGLLSEYGGPQAAVQYRVWVKTVDGKTFFKADPEFQGALIIWRQFQRDLEYYINIWLPSAVVWDRGIRSYREVTPDTLVSWIKSDSADWYIKWEKAEKERITAAKEELLAKRREELLKQQDIITASIAEEGEPLEATKPKRKKKKQKSLSPETIFEPVIELPKELPEELPPEANPRLPFELPGGYDLRRRRRLLCWRKSGHIWFKYH